MARARLHPGDSDPQDNPDGTQLVDVGGKRFLTKENGACRDELMTCTHHL